MTGGNQTTRLAIFALTGIALIWGVNWVIQKEALRYASPFDFSSLRCFFGALVLFLILLARREKIRLEDAPMVLLLGLLTTTGSIGLSTWALESGGAGKTAVLVYTMPLWVLVMAWPILDERIRGAQWAVTGLTIAGLLFILEPWRLQSGAFSKVLAILAGVAWAASSILLKVMKRRTSLDLLSVIAWQMLLGSIPLVFVAAAVPGRPIEWSPFFIGALFYNIVFTNAAANLLWFYALYHLPAGTAGLGSLATPVIGVIAAAAVLGERPSPWEAAGMIMILTGLVFLACLEKRKGQEVVDYVPPD